MVRPVEWLVSRFSVDMGIDLGTANTLVCLREQGIVLDEPSVVAVRKGSNEVLLEGQAVGQAALEYLGRCTARVPPPSDRCESGVIADFDDHREACCATSSARCRVGAARFVKPQVVIAVPWGITAVEKRAVIGSAERAGARRVYLVDEPTAAGIGAGNCPVHEPRRLHDRRRRRRHLRSGGHLARQRRRGRMPARGWRRLQRSRSQSYIRGKYNLLIGEITAERLKIAAGSALPLEEEIDVEVRGRDSLSGLPRRAVISSVDVREALEPPVRRVIGAIKQVLERTPPELAADLVASGITLCGGGSLLRGLDEMIERETELRTRVTESPLEAVARGTGIFLENLELYAQFLEGGDDLG